MIPQPAPNRRQFLTTAAAVWAVQRLTHSFVAFPACRSATVRMLASASATAVATVRKAPVMACAPILCILFIKAIPLDPHAYIHTFEA